MFDYGSRLNSLLQQSFTFFDFLCNKASNQEIVLGFSGGKDSHALLAVYFAWARFTGKTLPLQVMFSDTGLEAPDLLALISRIATFCQSNQTVFKIVKPKDERSYWYIQFALGYPVPNYRLRWCTKELKTKPMSGKHRITLTGRHKGESSNRDKKLGSCSSGECGIDLLKETIDPIVNWRNCDVWDFLGFVDGDLLPLGTIDALVKIYEVDMDENGSSRMGCAHCPVVAQQNIQRQVALGIMHDSALTLREISDSLIQAPRILSPQKSGVLGAILYSARVEAWQKVLAIQEDLIFNNWITISQLTLVTEKLKTRSYPPSYKETWIDSMEPQAMPWQTWQRQKEERQKALLSSFHFKTIVK